MVTDFYGRRKLGSTKRCRAFVGDPAPTTQLSIGAYTLTKLKRCFSVFKAMVLDAGQATASNNDGGGGGGMQPQGGAPTGEGAHAMESGHGELGGQVRKMHRRRGRGEQCQVLCSRWRQF